ncbi:DUF6953 family protein [Hafnia psychrotolerans]|uniref:RNA helicase n=1 Tax=Hafnia psychrotolerans TaxID=1477018 RepID=A0ABQ1G1T6_9GAMM|nr:hypothetical protein [Hafnia psychrotolerans]GGA33869.1 hypothetical protein GCM10011328_05890 [Hafnia psychrotolerans]
MENNDIAQWMLKKLSKEGCVYQDDVVDYLIKSKDESHLIENADGNQVLGRPLLNEFLKLTKDDVVWVRSGFYWRYRVAEDEPGRNARG